MRVFRFRDDQSPNLKQEQEVKCQIYLEDVESTYEEKQCECYTADECSGLGQANEPSPTTPITTSSTTSTTTQTTLQTTTQTTTQATTLLTTPTLDIKLYAGTVIYDIVVNGIRIGNNGDGGIIDVPMQQGETVIAIGYGTKDVQIGGSYQNVICGLTFITSFERELGPYGNAAPTDPYTIEYFLTIPGDVTLLDFLEQEKIMDVNGNWILGFESQILVDPTSEPMEPVMETTTSPSDPSEDQELEWIASSKNDCWGSCGAGSCPLCMDYDSEATAGYCCIGVNDEFQGDNADCPADAITAMPMTYIHSCVYSKPKKSGNNIRLRTYKVSKPYDFNKKLNRI